MELLNISNVKPGQTLARAITNADGAVLCPTGFKLTESAIERLKNAGVDSVVIEGGEDSGPSMEQRIAELRERFEGIDDPIMLQLKATIEKRLSFMRL